MAKKLYTALPSYINYDDISELINVFELEKEDFEVTWNSGGGSTAAGQMFVAYLNTTDKKIDADVAGLAASMGAMVLPAFNKTKGANQADIMIHAVAGGEESTQKHTNKLLYDLWANKIDLVKFKEVAGVDLKEVFFNDKRIEVWLTGKQAKYIGLFDESYDLSKAAEITNKLDLNKIDFEIPETIKDKYFKQAINTNINTNQMEIKDVTVSLLQSEKKDVHDDIFNSGKKAEQKRVAEIMKYAEYDMEKANALIVSGESLTIEHVEHFMEKKFDKKKVAELEENSEKEVKTAVKKTETKTAETADEKESKEASLEIRKILKTDDLLENETKN